jgi:hypothetical protein
MSCPLTTAPDFELPSASDSDPAYAHWRSEVDRLCQRHFTLGLGDLPDMPERSAFDAGTTPREFFEETVAPTLRGDFDDLIDDFLEKSAHEDLLDFKSEDD